MGFFDYVRQAKHERLDGVRASYGITQSSDSDVRCVECKHVSQAYSSTGIRDCHYHRIEVNCNEVCKHFSQ